MVSSAARVGSINVLLTTQFGQAVSGLNTFASTVEGTGKRTQQAVGGIDRSVLSLNRSLASINTRGLTGVTVSALRASTALDQMRGLALAAGVAVGGLVPATIVAGMIRTADGAHLLSNQLKTVTKDSADLKNTQDSLFDVAQRTRSAFDATVTIYARTARATEHLGLSQQKLLRITETVQKSFAIGGATAQEAQGAAIQLSQGIASNRFSGDEFRSVAENAPVLLRGMAESLGVNIGKLREMAHAGELTADVVTKAIIGASKRIDEEFAKTTSTIEQAWVKVGNAVTKYTMDSEGASVASNALVTVLNALAANIDTVADSLLLIGGAAVAAFTGRGLGAAKQWVGVLAATAVQSRLSAAEALKAAQVEAAANATRLASAKAYYAMVTQGVASERTRVVASRQLHSANIANLASQKALTAATQQHATALRAASVSGMAMAATGRAISSAWAFIGGPMGAALLAIGGVMYVVSKNAAEAEARSSRYADAIVDAGGKSLNSSGDIKKAAEALDLVASAATEAQRRVNLLTAQEDLKAFGNQASATIQQLGALNGWSSVGMQQELQKLWGEFVTGEKTLEELLKETDKLSDADPDTTKIIAKIQDIARKALAAMTALGLLKEEASNLTDLGIGTKSDRLPKELDDEDFNERWGSRYPTTKSWKEIFPDFYKPEKKQGAPRKTADDRFDNSIQSVLDRIQALREEREMLGATYYEQVKREEALKLEQEALKQAREEARKKGEADWQNAQISKEKRAEIALVTEELAREADANRRASEAMNLQKDIMKDVMSSLREALVDGTLSWEELGNIALRVLDKIINKIEDELIDAIFRMNQAGAGGGGVLGWLFGGGAAPAADPWGGLRVASAQGNVFSAPALSAYSNSVVTKPTVFPFAKGIGLMGEKAGSPGEAIMPLTRMAGGDLGVSVSVADDIGGIMGALVSFLDQMKGGGGLRVVVNNNGPPMNATVNETADSNGDRMLEIFLEKKIEDQVTRPSASTNRALRGTYGLSNQMVRR